MLCRLYDTKNNLYVKANETMDYAVHPTGAVLCNGVEDVRIDVELSSQLEDKHGAEIYAGDNVTDGVIFEEVVFKEGAFWVGAVPLADIAAECEVIGTIHDEDMEAV